MMTKTNEINNSLFNQNIKEQFLNEIKETTRISYERIFKITEPFENLLDKDISQFNDSEIETILYNFKANNRNTLESYARIISSYLNWSVEHNHVGINRLEKYKPNDFDKYLTNDEEYIEEIKLKRYEDRCQNYQDAIILRLLFVGAGGSSLSELRNIKKSDVDVIDPEKMELKLFNTLKEDKNGLPTKFTERYIKIDNRTLRLLQGAMEQKTYVKKNGYMQERDNVRPYTDLVDNDYVIRPSITKNEHWNSPVDKFVIYRRIAVLSETLGLDLTAKFIQRSGMVYFANELIQDENLSLDDIKMIANRFGIKSYHNLKGFLTVDNIRKYYNK